MKTELYNNQNNLSKEVRFSIIDVIEILMFIFLIVYLLMGSPLRFQFGKEIIKTGVVEDVTFEYEIYTKCQEDVIIGFLKQHLGYTEQKLIKV